MKQLRLLLAVSLAGCASLPPERAGDPGVEACRATYLALDTRTDRAGVRDAGVHGVEGFPYLRSNRLLASFRDEAKDGATFDAWVDRLRELDLAAREVELRNLGEPVPQTLLAELERCGRDWARRDLADTGRRAELRERVAVPDDYSVVRRALGLYPLAVPFLRRGVSSYQAEVRADYETPLKALEAPGPLVLWKPRQAPAVAAATAARWIASSRDALGIPRLSATQWRQLADTHAPHWWIETGGEFDRPGAPVLAQGEPAFDAQRPVTYYLTSFTRHGKRVLPQLVYVVWFGERPKDGLVDSYAGTLDGVVWRVTLGAHGRPLLYDSIHPCGCYHRAFSEQRLRREPPAGIAREPFLMPQPRMPARPFALRVSSRTHQVRRLVPLAEAAAAETRRYELADYRELLSLPTGLGTSRSLFGADGIARGTERFERFWLWPAGIVSPGAMRQAGRQAIAFVGRRHFDDPFLLDEMLETAPEATSTPAAPKSRPKVKPKDAKPKAAKPKTRAAPARAPAPIAR